VDFVLHLDGEAIPVEVKTHAKLERGFLSFLGAHKPRKALVFTRREFGVRKIGDTKVAFVPHFFI